MTLLQFELHAGCPYVQLPHLPLLLQGLVRSDGGAEVEADKCKDHGNLHPQRVSAFQLISLICDYQDESLTTAYRVRLIKSPWN